MNYKSEKILIGHKLKKLRLNLNISQTDMASEIGISSSYLNLLENNQRPVTVQLLFRLSQAYNIDLKELSDDESEKLTAELMDKIERIMETKPDVPRDWTMYTRL